MEQQVAPIPSASSAAERKHIPAGEDTARDRKAAESGGVVQLFSQDKKEAAPEESAERVSKIVEALQDSMDMIRQRNTHLRFSVHEDTEEIMVKVTDQDSGEVIREIPSEEFLDIAAKFEEMVGLMFDIKA
jgi:flagellar protein FlaG